MLHNIILGRYDRIPKQIDNIPIDTQIELYKIIAAPVPYHVSSCRKAALEYVGKQSYGKYNIKYILSTTGACLSIIDKTLIEGIQESYREQWGIDILNKEDIALIDKCNIRDLCVNVEFALIILLLKFINSTYTYDYKLQNPNEIHAVQRAYNENVMFIAKLQQSCYGTANEQVEVFEKLMPYYLKENITSTKM